MASPSNLSIMVSVDTSMLCLTFDCMSDLLKAQTDWERGIYLNALRALAEARDAGDAARKELGLQDHDLTLRISVTVDPNQKGGEYEVHHLE